MKDWKRKKVAILLRRSEGEKGTPQDQLERIKPMLLDLVKKGKIKKIDWNIVGKDIEGKKRFSRKRDLVLKGDVFNEGRGTSAMGLNEQDRPVAMELLRRMDEGQYEAVIAESLDRFSRDPLSFAYVALPLWRDKSKIFWGLQENEGWGANQTPHEESIIVTKLMWGGEAKKGEIRKSKSQLAAAVLRGFVPASKPEWLGSKSKAHGLDYRKAWELMQKEGEREYKGNMILNNPTDVGEPFGKDNKWASLWYSKMKAWDDLGVLYNWLDGVEQVNEYIRNHQYRRPRDAFKQTDVKNIINSTRGFFGYPAGVNIAKTERFVIFPDPADLDLVQLGINKDPRVVEGFEVQDLEVGDRKLAFAQTQPKAR